VIGYLLIILLGPYFLSIFYPDWASESQKLLSVTGLAAIMTLVNGFINPIILRFRSMKWQFVINLTLFVSNLLFSLTLGLLFGLYGFAIGVLIAQSIALLMKLYVFKFTKSI
jgi:Na+-driven multidrug efflux pump